MADVLLQGQSDETAPGIRTAHGTLAHQIRQEIKPVRSCRDLLRKLTQAGVIVFSLFSGCLRLFLPQVIPQPAECTARGINISKRNPAVQHMTEIHNPFIHDRFLRICLNCSSCASDIYHASKLVHSRHI